MFVLSCRSLYLKNNNNNNNDNNRDLVCCGRYTWHPSNSNNNNKNNDNNNNNNNRQNSINRHNEDKACEEPSDTVIHFYFYFFTSSTGELCSQPIRGNDRRIGRMFPEHVERSFWDSEYSFDEYFQLVSRRKVRPIKNQIGSPNTPTTGFSSSDYWSTDVLSRGLHRHLFACFL